MNLAKIIKRVGMVALLGLVLASPATAAVFTKDLSYGITNDSEVTQLQEFLAQQGIYNGPITGNFYSLTQGAVRIFQEKNNISPLSGYFGPKTRIVANNLVGASISEETPIAPQASTTVQVQLEALLKQIALLQDQLKAQQETASSTKELQDQIQNQNQIIQQQNQTLGQIQQNTQAIQSSTQQMQQNATPVNTCAVTLPNCQDPMSNDYYLARGLPVPGINLGSAVASDLLITQNPNMTFNIKAVGEDMRLDVVTTNHADWFKVGDYQSSSDYRITSVMKSCVAAKSIFQEFGSTTYPYDCPDEYYTASSVDYSGSGKYNRYNVTLYKDKEVRLEVNNGSAQLYNIQVTGLTTGKVISK